MDGYLSALMHKFYALMVCGWYGLHGMNPWVTKEDVKWEIKINNMAYCFLYNWPNLDRQQNYPLCGSLQIVISFDGDDLINDICLSIPSLFYEFKGTNVQG